LRDRGIALLKAARDVAESVVETDEPAAAPVAAFCTGCGTQLDAAWQFCAKCGAPAGANTNVSNQNSEAEPSQ
jgi:predicted amidophosphoribosyltransferase